MSKLETYISEIVYDRKFTNDQKVDSLEGWLHDLLESLVDDGECSFDHHGGCQAHGYLSLEPGEKCPQQELRDLLAEDKTHV